MPAHPVERCPSARVMALLRSLAVALGLALGLALLVSGCSSEGKPGATPKDIPTKGEVSKSPEAPAADPGFQAPVAGQCFEMTPRQSRASVAAGSQVKCRAAHNTIVAFVGYLPTPVTPKTALAERRALGARLCQPAFRRLVGGTLADRATSILTWTLFTPGQAQLERGARWVRCDVLARSGSRLIPLPPGRPLLRKGIPEQLRVCQNRAGADVSCSLPHAFRVEAVFRETGSGYPAAPAYTPVVRNRCRELMGKYGGYWQPPSRAGWRAGDRFIRCLAATP